jgi:hypothetical protein
MAEWGGESRMRMEDAAQVLSTRFALIQVVNKVSQVSFIYFLYRYNTLPIDKLASGTPPKEALEMIRRRHMARLTP